VHNLVTATVLSVSAIALPLAAQAQDGCKLDKSEHVFSQAPNGPLKTHVFSPPGTKGKPRPAIVIFHGGGWVMGDPSWSFWLTDRFACKGMVTIVAQYRLSDQKTASPAEAIDDARAAIDWTRAHAKEFNIDPTRVAALGWSAGAHLAASAAVFATDKTQSPDLLALVSPAVSVVEDRGFFAGRTRPAWLATDGHGDGADRHGDATGWSYKIPGAYAGGWQCIRPACL
jgi:acetyl esterase/lipase